MGSGRVLLCGGASQIRITVGVSGRSVTLPTSCRWALGDWGTIETPPSHTYTCYKKFFPPYLKNVHTNGKLTRMYDELILNLDQKLNIPGKDQMVNIFSFVGQTVFLMTIGSAVVVQTPP